MSTAAELQSQIDGAQHILRDRSQFLVQVENEINEAEERQRLRRILEEVHQKINETNLEISFGQRFRREIDRDIRGVHLLNSDASFLVPRPDPRVGRTPVRQCEKVNCCKGIAKGEYVWKIEGLSWLVDSLKQNEEERIEAEDELDLGGLRFDFFYTPLGGRNGTLAIVTRFHEPDAIISFRFKIFVKRRAGDFHQWGDTCKICARCPTNQPYGPDVPSEGHTPQRGIFGLSHEALLHSEWVEDDALTVKFELEVRPQLDIESSGVYPLEPQVDVPPASIISDLSSFLQTSKGSDVTFIVRGDSLKAHSQILCARSEVFDRLLNSGMCESISKEIVVEDCSSSAFKVLLHFMYTDDLQGVEKMLKDASSDQRSDETVSDNDRKPYDQCLQDMLAVSHRYQLSRLRLWCEQQLCKSISVDEVCSILRQAHLYDAKQLETTCLSFIQQNLRELVVTEKFGTLSRDWPEVMLKINIFMAGVAETSAAAAFEAHRRVGKRKRDD